MPAQPSPRKSINILLMSALILQSGCRGWIEKPIVPDAGTAIPRRGTAAPHQRMAIARTNVTKIEVRGDTTPEGVRTAGKIYLGVVGTVAIVGMTLIAIALYGISPQ